ncbi:hypothetical protein Dsin_015182 [Dipteronia sinensis]|uniref:Endonuclease/exonuclease/phosphatase domain-containing protein n=1 Tax=Dipteronia sinensis TaxID=43782 RepID=A0AAE0AAR8_9ROSI|nr:hypothetical protein Dsin_015182 [Dipteronia sinensis]
MIVMTWNVRGFGKGEKKVIVNGLVNRHNPEILFIQESKLKVFNNKVIRSLGGSRLTTGVGVEIVGASGGLITLWDENAFKAEDCITNRRCIIVAGVLTKINQHIVFCNVYAASVEAEMREMWGFILSSMQSLSAPWCLGGDFNTILDQS